MLRGADVSEYQRKIDYSKAKKDIAFIIPRSGFAQTTDKMFRTNVSTALMNGVAVPAIYHFSYALSENDAIAEANYAISECQAAGLPKSTIIFFDLEYDSVTYAKKNGVTLGKEKCDLFTKAFCNQVIKMGYRTGIYLNLDYYKNMYFQTTLNDERYFIWLADWTGGPDRPCAIQQYTSKGTVAGINGNVDMNYIYDDRVMGSAKDPTEVKSIEDIAIEVIGGKWGAGGERKTNLTLAGYDYNAVQNMVNSILNGTADTVHKHQNGDSIELPVQSDQAKIGWYKMLKDDYIRQGPSDNKFAACVVAEGVTMYCSGMYVNNNDEIWLFVTGTPFNNGKVYQGYLKAENAKKID